jgi:formylglycine-generating enzyme required for sulfatase activity
VAGLGKSAYNSTPLAGSENLSGDNFNELAKRAGKRLLTLAEWRQAAEGSPQGEDGNNTNAWAATTNSARHATGTVQYAISAHNIMDCVGNLWEWLAEYIGDYTSVSWAWVNFESGAELGQGYLPNSSGVKQVMAGGGWAFGVIAGSRAVYLDTYPWYVSSAFGARFACD